MLQSGFAFTPPPEDLRTMGPTGEARVPAEDIPAAPFRGKTIAARHAGWTGARYAVLTWSTRQSKYLQLLDAGGALTDHEAAALAFGGLVGSVNSVRNQIEKRFFSRGLRSPFVDCGFDTRQWEHGTSQRTRWGLRAKGGVLMRELRETPVRPKPGQAVTR